MPLPPARCTGGSSGCGADEQRAPGSTRVRNRTPSKPHGPDPEWARSMDGDVTEPQLEGGRPAELPAGPRERLMAVAATLLPLSLTCLSVLALGCSVTNDAEKIVRGATLLTVMSALGPAVLVDELVWRPGPWTYVVAGILWTFWSLIVCLTRVSRAHPLLLFLSSSAWVAVGFAFFLRQSMQ